jgi:hypothetical protein
VGKEVKLEVNQFKTSGEYEGMMEKARLIQNLFLMKKGSHPTHPDIGLGIEQYEFERLNDSLIREITVEANEQIQRFIPNNNFTGVNIQPLEGKDGSISTVGVSIGINTELSEEQIGILFNKSEVNSKIVSHIII